MPNSEPTPPPIPLESPTHEGPPPKTPSRRPIPAPPPRHPSVPRGVDPLGHPPRSPSGTGWTWLIVFLIAGGAGWWWKEHRGQAGQWAGEEAADSTENKAVTGGKSGEGEVLVIAKPWGRIEKTVERGGGTEVPLPAGSPFTPRLARLPSGRYEISLSHPDGGTRTCEVEITANSKSTCEVRFFEIEPRDYFQEVGW